MVEDEKSCLEKLKEDYKELQIKYNLPEFNELNQDFNIEKIAETETELLLKEIRKFMFEKFSNYMRFLESLLNPSNASLFTFSVLKALNTDDKKLVENIYKKLMKIEIDLMEVDIEYIEEKEADFVKNSYTIWNDVKKDWIKIISSAKNNWENNLPKDNKGYFG